MTAVVPPTPDPARLDTDVVLRDGSTVRIRTATTADRDLVEDYFLSLSDESRRLRFWTHSVDVSEQAARTVDVDGDRHVTVLALIGGRMVGGSQYFREGASARAEVSVSVADDLQGHGLGSILIGLLAQIARDRGILLFHAEVLPENHRMINVFRATGFVTSIRAKPGAVEVEFPTTITEETIEQYEERERIADANAVRTFLRPRAVAVIGASREPGSIGGRLFRNLITQPFTGVVYPVNPKAPVVQGVTAFPSILDVPGDVDVAFVVVPAVFVNDVVRQCGEKGVRSLVVISSGFGEVGEEGLHLQEELVATCRAYGMRMIGPNCMGVTNSDPEVRLNGTFGTAWAPEGRVAFMSQSGALGLAVMNQAASLGMGLSSFVSVGNKADVSANDLLAYWDDDERTDVILLYMESFGNPRRFARLARRIGERKPVVVVKSGRSAAGQRAASSHTGALLAASDTTVDAVFRQHGVIRTDTLEEMFDVATLLVNQPVPEGPRVAIVTNAGGLGIQCADMCEARGLEVIELSDATVERLRSFLPAEASVGNPVDMIASATHEDYGRAIRTVAGDPDVDALIVIYIPPLEQDAPSIARAMVDAIASLPRTIPVLTCFMSSRGVPDDLRAPGVRIPSYGYPEQAAIALAHAAEHGAWRRRPQGRVPRYPGIDEDAAHGITARALSRGDEWLTPDDVGELLDCYGLPRVRERKVVAPDEAGTAATELGTRVALKAVGPIHKTEVGAVALDLSPADVADTARAMAERVAAHGEPLEGFVVQEMVPAGVEMLVGSATDPVFGPVVAVGAGGVTVELTRDVQVGVAPLTDVQADTMVRSLATFPLLNGFRGAPAADVPALVDVLLRLSAMADAHPEIVEMDCNPVIVLERGAVIVDARIRVRTPAPAPPFAPRAGD
ncbi:MAG TPA: GNAT family N-acetyltransferase [Actinomycetota bacterium]|nr:GNAT family N-acetyltransferase [Actinomycetota bacterium]